MHSSFSMAAVGSANWERKESVDSEKALYRRKANVGAKGVASMCITFSLHFNTAAPQSTSPSAPGPISTPVSLAVLHFGFLRFGSVLSFDYVFLVAC